MRAATSVARLRAAGKRQQARKLPGRVYDWFADGFDPQDLEDVKAALDDLGRQ